MARAGKRAIRRVAAATIAGLSAAAMLSSCAVNEIGFGGGEILIGGGASSQQAAQAVWVVGFQLENTAATVEYDPAGSGAGRDMFAAGGAAFAASDRAYTTDEVVSLDFSGCEAGSGIIELPAYISPIAIVFKLDGISSLKLDADTIARIFTGEISQWNDDEIVKQNPDAALPDAHITAVHRSDDSGVTENFTEYLAAAAPTVWTHEPSGEWPLEGEAAQGTSGVVDSVRNGTGTIGYVDASRVGELGSVSVKVGDNYVPYSSEAAAAIIDESGPDGDRAPGDLAIHIDRTSDAEGVYPVVLVSYLIGCADYIDDSTAELTKRYFSHVISPEAQNAAAESAGSAPLSPAMRARAEDAVSLIK